MSDENEEAKQIAELNDRFRLRFNMPFLEKARPMPGGILATRGVMALPSTVQVSIWETVRRFDDFTEDNDPHGEHDFGGFDAEGAQERILWEIDYYADARSAMNCAALRPVTARSALKTFQYERMKFFKCWKRSNDNDAGNQQPPGRLHTHHQPDRRTT